jgi:hypothetical protein
MAETDRTGGAGFGRGSVVFDLKSQDCLGLLFLARGGIGTCVLDQGRMHNARSPAAGSRESRALNLPRECRIQHEVDFNRLVRRAATRVVLPLLHSGNGAYVESETKTAPDPSIRNGPVGRDVNRQQDRAL